jgi:hypothetical protein
MTAQTALHDRLLKAVQPDPFNLPRVTVRVSEGNPELVALLLRDRPLTADEQEFVDRCERNAA